jgi:tetratricopeptide (TPR) repeat protein
LTYKDLGDIEHARTLTENNVRAAQALGDKQIESRSLDALAGYALDDGRTQDAIGMLKDAYRVNHDAGDVSWKPIVVCRFARALAVAGRVETAARVLSSAEVLLKEIGSRPAWIEKMNEQTLTAIRAELDDDAFAEAWDRGRKLTADETVALAFDSSD